MKIKKAVIPVAGLGTRMLPATKAIPKELLPIYDKPLIQYVVEEAIDSGIEEIIFITRSGKEAIENHFDDNFELEKSLKKRKKTKILKSVHKIVDSKINIISIRQEEPKGLGHAILCAEKIINGDPFAVLLPDEILLKKQNKNNDLKTMIRSYETKNDLSIMVEEVKIEEISNYGLVYFDDSAFRENSLKNIKSIVEKPKSSPEKINYRIIGRYILPNEIFNILKKIKFEKDKEIELTEGINKYLKLNPSSVNAYLSSSRIFDCGSKKGFIGANIAIAAKKIDMQSYIQEILK